MQLRLCLVFFAQPVVIVRCVIAFCQLVKRLYFLLHCDDRIARHVCNIGKPCSNDRRPLLQIFFPQMQIFGQRL